MKKKICILMLGVMVFISGCTNSGDSAKEQDNKQPVVEQQTTDKKEEITDSQSTGGEDHTATSGEGDQLLQEQKLAAYEECQALLDRIDQTIEMGTAGSSLKCVQATAALMDWAAATEMTAEEIQQATTDWLMPKGNDEQSLFARKMQLVDGYYQQLLTEGQEGMLSDAGCTEVGYPWGNEPMEPVEAVMTAVGLR